MDGCLVGLNVEQGMYYLYEFVYTMIPKIREILFFAISMPHNIVSSVNKYNVGKMRTDLKVIKFKQSKKW